jgi:hypothetical protein
MSETPSSHEVEKYQAIAAGCEQKAQVVDDANLSAYYRRIAKQWRKLAKLNRASGESKRSNSLG